MSSGNFPAEERTRPTGPKLHAAPSIPPDEFVTDEELLGKMMREVIGVKVGLRDVNHQLSLLSGEIRQLSRAVELDRTHLVNQSSTKAATKAAAHSSNRMAGLVTTLFIVWEAASPYLHEFIKLIHK